MPPRSRAVRRQRRMEAEWSPLSWYKKRKADEARRKAEQSRARELADEKERQKVWNLEDDVKTLIKMRFLVEGKLRGLRKDDPERADLEFKMKQLDKGIEDLNQKIDEQVLGGRVAPAYSSDQSSLSSDSERKLRKSVIADLLARKRGFTDESAEIEREIKSVSVDARDDLVRRQEANREEQNSLTEQIKTQRQVLDSIPERIYSPPVQVSSSESSPTSDSEAEAEKRDIEFRMSSGGMTAHRRRQMMTRAMRTAAATRRSGRITAEGGVRYRDVTTGRFVSMRSRC